MNYQGFENLPDEKQIDDLALKDFADAMHFKMDLARSRGRSGWANPAVCSAQNLSNLLRSHVEKGDPVDVANFAMMLHQRGSPILKRSLTLNGHALDGSDRLPGQALESRQLIEIAHCLTKLAAQAGYVVTIERKPLHPLAMGNASYEIDLRPARSAK